MKIALGAALLLVTATACVGGVKPVACIFETDCVEGEVCTAGSCLLVPPTCPKNLKPTFTDINAQLFQLGCGSKSNACHGDAAVTDHVNGLSLQTDPYKHLVGVLADNVGGRPKGILRVKQGDALQSLLVIKLKLKTADDPVYGSSMPFDNPGAICDDTIKVISQWIAAGAPND